MMKGVTMKRLFILAALVSSCDRQSQQSAVTPSPTPTDEVLASRGPSSKPPEVVPLPKDQAELDRMILAGYTPHGNHLHPPGVKECPLAQGTEAVM